MLIALLAALAFAPVYWLLVPAPWRPAVVTIASLVGLGIYDVRLVGVLVVGVLLLHGAMRTMEGRGRPVRVTVAVAGVLSFAALFVWNKMRATGGGAVASQEGLVFLGLSYLALKATAVLVDRAREAVAPVALGDLLRWIVFLPTYTSGPIEELDHFRRQTPHTDRERIGRGLERILFGLVKALVVSHLLAEWAGPYLAAPEQTSRTTLLLATYAFTFRFYFDFAGYSDIAIGAAALYGYEIQENFDRPLVRRNIVLLWQGWHMTLTRWLRTYLFVPVSRQIMRRGDGRFDSAAIIVAQLVTMVFCGLWHGITWGFALWGAAQAMGLVWVGLFARRVGRQLPDAWLRFWRRHPVGTALSIALTFNAFSFSNVLVYSTLAQALRIYGRLFGA